MRKHWLLFTRPSRSRWRCCSSSTRSTGVAANAARGGVVTLYESAMPDGFSKSTGAGLSVAAKKAMPAVVNIFTSTQVKTPVYPFMDDPRFRFFFGEQDERSRKAAPAWAQASSSARMATS